MVCQKTNGVNDSLIRPPVAKLCRVASHMKMLFRDTWSLSVWDDMLIVGNGKRIIKRLKNDLGRQFSMKDLGLTQQILGMIIIRDIRNKKMSYYSGVILHSEQVQL